MRVLNLFPQLLYSTKLANKRWLGLPLRPNQRLFLTKRNYLEKECRLPGAH
jgi:hypothetical protein